MIYFVRRSFEADKNKLNHKKQLKNAVDGILKNAFAKMGIDYSRQQLCFNSYGKPYLDNRPDIFFNISHSGNYVLCAFGDENVGCDVEIINTYNDKVVNRFFTVSEQKVLNSSNKKDVDFTRLWTLKESVLKFTGSGVGGGLSSYDFSEYVQKDDFNAYGLNFKVIESSDKIISICSQGNRILQRKADTKDIFDEKGEKS